MCKNVGVSLQFVRKYGPALRYYNPELAVAKTHSDEGPLTMEVLVFKKSSEDPVPVNPD